MAQITSKSRVWFEGAGAWKPLKETRLKEAWKIPEDAGSEDVAKETKQTEDSERAASLKRKVEEEKETAAAAAAAAAKATAEQKKKKEEEAAAKAAAEKKKREEEEAAAKAAAEKKKREEEEGAAKAAAEKKIRLGGFAHRLETELPLSLGAFSSLASCFYPLFRSATPYFSFFFFERLLLHHIAVVFTDWFKSFAHLPQHDS